MINLNTTKDNNIKRVSSESLNKSREDFQEKLSIDNFLYMDELVKNKKQVYLKALFSKEQRKKTHPYIKEDIFINQLTPNYKGMTEAMWILCGDINIEQQTICGVLLNNPHQISNLKFRDIVVISFSDILDIDYNIKN